MFRNAAGGPVAQRLLERILQRVLGEIEIAQLSDEARQQAPPVFPNGRRNDRLGMMDVQIRRRCNALRSVEVSRSQSKF